MTGFAARDVTESQTCSGADVASCSVDTRTLFPGVKQSESEANQSPPCSAEVHDLHCTGKTVLYVLDRLQRGSHMRL